MSPPKSTTFPNYWCRLLLCLRSLCLETSCLCFPIMSTKLNHPLVSDVAAGWSSILLCWDAREHTVILTVGLCHLSMLCVALRSDHNKLKSLLFQLVFVHVFVCSIILLTVFTRSQMRSLIVSGWFSIQSCSMLQRTGVQVLEPRRRSSSTTCPLHCFLLILFIICIYCYF